MRTPGGTNGKKPETTTGLGAQRLFPNAPKLFSMEDTVRTVRVSKLRANLEIRRVEAATLMVHLDSPSLTVQEKRAFFRRWDEAVREVEVLEFMLELIRREDRERREFLDSLA
jgi:hypothetical protein